MAAAAAVILFTMCNGEKKECTACDAAVDAQKAVIDNIMTRSSVRAYTDQAVSDSLVETMLRAAMAAPTAVNKQPWRFVVIRDRAILDSIAANMEYMKMVAQAPIAIVVCGEIDPNQPEALKDYWIQDCCAATENLLLAAHALGLGAVWCGVTPTPHRMEYIKNVLSLPNNIQALNVIAIGYPAGEQHPKDKWKPENIHYDRW